MRTYTVKSGDSLSSIARDELGNINLWPTLASLNRINAPYVIQPGEILDFPDAPAAIKAEPITQTVTPVATQTKSFLGISIGGILLIAGIVTAIVVYEKKKKKKS